jgi:hypothetical protein
VIASVDTYLRFAEAVNRLDLQPREQATGLPGLVGELREGGARQKTRGALEGVKDSAKEVASSFSGDEAEEEEPAEQDRRAPAKRAAPRARRSTRRTRTSEES